MPNFDFNIDENISIDEFLTACDSNDIKELIDALIEDGYLDKKEKSILDPRVSAAEEIFEDHLNAIHGKWNQLTVEEEDMIMKIAKRFK